MPIPIETLMRELAVETLAELGAAPPQRELRTLPPGRTPAPEVTAQAHTRTEGSLGALWRSLAWAARRLQCDGLGPAGLTPEAHAKRLLGQAVAVGRVQIRAR